MFRTLKTEPVSSVRFDASYDIRFTGFLIARHPSLALFPVIIGMLSAPKPSLKALVVTVRALTGHPALYAPVSPAVAGYPKVVGAHRLSTLLFGRARGALVLLLESPNEEWGHTHPITGDS